MKLIRLERITKDKEDDIMITDAAMEATCIQSCDKAKKLIQINLRARISSDHDSAMMMQE